MTHPPSNEPNSDEPTIPLARARVAAHAIYVYRAPSFRSERLGMLKRDEIISILEEITAANGPPTIRFGTGLRRVSSTAATCSVWTERITTSNP